MSANIPDPQAVLEQLEEIKRKYLAAQTDVSAVRATGFDQDRHVSVTVLGLGEVSDVKIAPAAVDPADVDGLQRKILQAFRSANDQARDLAAQILSPLNIALPELEATAQGQAAAGSAAEPAPGRTAEPEPAAPEPPEDAPDSPSLSAPSSEAVPSLSPGVSLSPALSSLASGLSAASADVSLTEFPGASPEEPEAAASGPAAPEPAPQRPSLANYRHYRPRW